MTARLSALVALLAASASPAFGFCGSRTHLAARAADGEAVEVKNFGYFGETVSTHCPARSGPVHVVSEELTNTQD